MTERLPSGPRRAPCLVHQWHAFSAVFGHPVEERRLEIAYLTSGRGTQIHL